MKISISKLNVSPKPESDKLEVCLYGLPSPEIVAWIVHHNLPSNFANGYTSIIFDKVFDKCERFDDLFLPFVPFSYMDGFSPNLNKKLHVGHLSNLVLAKAFCSIGVCKDEGTVSIFGDTLEGDVKQEDAEKSMCNLFEIAGYHPKIQYYASKVKYYGDKLVDGTGKYDGSKVFKIGDEQIVGIKSSGNTSYFYQDVCLAEILEAPTLYLTGSEQNPHFKNLKALFPEQVNHIGLGLVKLSGGKMSSRLGNVVLIEDFFAEHLPNFNNDPQLVYNVFAGFILKSAPGMDKNINTDTMSNPKNSAGLYVSYTMARLHSAGIQFVIADTYSDNKLWFAHMKAVHSMKPHILLEALVEYCSEVNKLYATNRIVDNPDNIKLFTEKMGNLLKAAHSIGLHTIKQV